jgi:hypothetical protein
MNTIGFDNPLYILPFDHRGTFQGQMFGWKGALTREQTERITSAKQVIYDAFKAAVAAGPRRRKPDPGGRAVWRAASYRLRKSCCCCTPQRALESWLHCSGSG